MKNVSPFYDTVICCIAKNENDYIYEWVKYHLHIGFDHIFIYDNNDSNYEYIGDKLIEFNDFVTIIGKRDCTSKTKLQIDVYNEFYLKYFKNFKWCAFIDIDEFIVINNFANVKVFLDQDIFKSFDSIILKWKVYGDDGYIKRDMKVPVHKFFKNQVICKYKYGKCLVKGGNENIYFDSVHRASLKDKEISQCNGDGISTFDRKLELDNTKDSETAFINHYMTKTLDEFIAYKLKRSNALNFNINKWEYYFSINKTTNKKISYIFRKTFRFGSIFFPLYTFVYILYKRKGLTYRIIKKIRRRDNGSKK